MSSVPAFILGTMDWVVKGEGSVVCWRRLVPAHNWLFIIFRHFCKQLSKLDYISILLNARGSVVFDFLCNPMNVMGLPGEEYWLSCYLTQFRGSSQPREWTLVSWSLPLVNYIKTIANMQKVHYVLITTTFNCSCSWEPSICCLYTGGNANETAM